MSKFDRKKIAVTLAFASLFGSKTSAINLNKTQVKSAQNFGAVSNNNPNFYSNPMPYPRMLEKPRGMSNLAKVGIAVGSILGIVFLANEGLGAFTDAETLYKGKFSFANGIKYLSAPTLEQKMALHSKIVGVLDSFGSIEKREAFTKKALTSEESSRIAVESDCGATKLECLRDAVAAAALAAYVKLGDSDEILNALEESYPDAEIKCATIANGYTYKIRKNKNQSVIVAKFGVNSTVIELEAIDKIEAVYVKTKIKYVYTMNEDGSLTVESIRLVTGNGKRKKSRTKATFYMPGQESAGKEAPKIRNPEVQTSMPKSVPKQENSGQGMPSIAGLNNDMKMFVPTSGQGNSGQGMPGMAGLNNDMKMFIPTSGQGDSRQEMQQMAKFGNEMRMFNNLFGMFNMG